jgi:hypothetical protein
MQSAKLTADPEFAEPPVLGEPPALLDEGLLLHAATSRTRAAVVMMAAAVRGVAGRGLRRRRGREPTRMLSFIAGIGFMPAVLRADR